MGGNGPSERSSPSAPRVPNGPNNVRVTIPDTPASREKYVRQEHRINAPVGGLERERSVNLPNARKEGDDDLRPNWEKFRIGNDIPAGRFAQQPTRGEAWSLGINLGQIVCPRRRAVRLPTKTKGSGKMRPNGFP